MGRREEKTTEALSKPRHLREKERTAGNLRRGLECTRLGGRQRLLLLLLFPHVFSTWRSQVAPSCSDERKERRVQPASGAGPSALTPGSKTWKAPTRPKEAKTGGEQQKTVNGASYLPGGTVRSLPGYRRRLIVPPLVLAPPFHLGRRLLLLLSTVRFLHLPGAGCDKLPPRPCLRKKRVPPPLSSRRPNATPSAQNQSEKSTPLAPPAACPSSRHPRDELT